MEEAGVASDGATTSGIPNYPPVVIPPAPENAMSYDGSGPRLMITQIVNENFKSYAGTQTLGPFHKNFSAIVGPNGSGKSNVIDSMLFVFGYRASKIRSKKISILIHSSDTQQNIDSCTVSVHFQKILDHGVGDDNYEVVPGSQFVVSRTAFRDNSSYYKIDDRRMTYKDVAAVLRGCGIDLDHNRFLILQGEVEQIAMMKPKGVSEHEDGMLEFLEDIIGSSRYQQPISVLSQRVEELNELRGEKLNRVKAVEREKDDLETVKNEAVEYLQLENDIVTKKNVLYQKYIMECSESEKDAAEKRDVVKAKVKEIDEKLSQLNETKKAKAKDVKKAQKKLEELTKLCDDKSEEFKQLEHQDTKTREDSLYTHSQSKKLQKTLAQEQKKLADLQLIPEKCERELGELTQQLDALHSDKLKEEQHLQEVMDSFKSETEDLQKQKELKEEELLGLQKVVDDRKSKYAVAQSELTLYKGSHDSEAKKLAETQSNLAKTSSTLRECHSTAEDLREKIPAVAKDLEKSQNDLANIVTEENRAANELRLMRVRVEEARSCMQAARSQNKVLESLMQLKRSGRVPGIHGRLGDLGAIDEKYDVAVSTACPSLDHIVVDTINTAQQCVEYLKQNGIGIATFIGMDKMDRWKTVCRKPLTTPEGVPRLFDLVKVKDESFLPVFYFGLRDTLVAADLEQATRISYGKTRHRVVTLAGQLIEISGTMSGGGNKVIKGKMSSTITDEIDEKSMQNLEKQLEKETRSVTKCRESRTRLEEHVESLRKTHTELLHNRDKCALDIKSMTEQQVILQRQEKEQQHKVKASVPDKKRLNELENQVEHLKKGFDEAHDAAEKVESLVNRLHQQIMDIGGNKLKAVQSRLDMINGRIDQTTALKNKANVAVKTAKRNEDKTQQKIVDIQKDIAENQTKYDKLQDDLKHLDAEAKKLLDERQQAVETKKKLESELSAMTAEVNQEDTEETELKKGLIAEKNELDTLEASVKDNAAKTKHWKRELGKLSLHQVELDQPVQQLAQLTAEQIADEISDEEHFSFQITKLEQQLGNMKPNLAAIAEYRKKEEVYLKRVAELDRITDVRNSQRKQHDDLRRQRLDEFMAGFNVITTRLKEMYQMITLGGDAELELVDSLDPFSEGIVFSVRPPKKSWKNISNLSGGEKTLSSLALVFALHHYKPTPLYVMDEIDAALDFKNVSIVANYIKERTRNAQFVIISLRNNMFELADRLVGIYKTHNCTKSVTINPHSIAFHDAPMES